MTNHPNRNQGRPPKAPEDRFPKVRFTLSPEVAAAVQKLPERTRSARVDEILRAALVDRFTPAA